MMRRKPPPTHDQIRAAFLGMKELNGTITDRETEELAKLTGRKPREPTPLERWSESWGGGT